MAEVLRLQIVYETNAAALSLARLNPVQRETTRGLKTIEGGMKSLAVSALGVPGPVGKVAEGLLKFGTGGLVTLTVVAGIGLIATAYKQATEDSNRFLKASDDLEKQLASLGASPRAGLVKQLSDAGVALDKFKQQASFFAPGSTAGGAEGFLARFKAGPEGPALFVQATHAMQEQEAIQKRIKELIAAGDVEHAAALTKALTAERERAQLAWQTATLFRLEQGTLEASTTLRFGRAGIGAVSPFDTIRFGQDATRRSLDQGFGQRPDAPLRSLDTRFQGANMGLGARPEELLTNELTRQQKRIVDSWSDGLHAMQDSVNEFLVTGKFAIQDLINTFLSIAFRAASEGFIETAVNKTIDKISHSNAAKRAVGGKV